MQKHLCLRKVFKLNYSQKVNHANDITIVEETPIAVISCMLLAMGISAAVHRVCATTW